METNCIQLYEVPSVTAVEVTMDGYILQMSGTREGGGYGNEFDLDAILP